MCSIGDCDDSNRDAIHFEVTGSAAFSRIQPLLPREWINSTSLSATTDSNDDSTLKRVPQFLWENAPRPETRDYRDQVLCYSHLPNGMHVLDSKWALARLFREVPSLSLACTLPSHCFRGKTGFQHFCEKVGMFKPTKPQPILESRLHSEFPDLLETGLSTPCSHPSAPTNLWVIKDDMSNGAGGIWMVSPANAAQFLPTGWSNLIEEHRYVAQQYVWPPVLYGGRKCHVRVYGLITADHKAYLHRKCFLHVANEMFTAGNYQEAAIHITNCCANSHDSEKFAGEICADLYMTHNSQTDCGHPIVPLARYYSSISASVKLLAERSFPFLKGGEMNGGFEYLGIDFILSEGGKAYLLEVNAPPSQDTATGLPHAENLHNAVLSDLISMWVMPRINGAPSLAGGWDCVYTENIDDSGMLPSKAVILNKIRWAIFERKCIKQNEEEKRKEQEIPTVIEHEPHGLSPTCIANYARLQFPYFASKDPWIFMENAGGAQVSYSVIDAMQQSLCRRNRSTIGHGQQQEARIMARTLLGCGPNQSIYFGTNASCLLQSLAHKLSQTWQVGDEIILSTENHLANITPWIEAAERAGVVVKWWSINDDVNRLLLDDTTNVNGRNCIRLVALTHVSNVLGCVRHIDDVVAYIHHVYPQVQIVVDGVAAVPHVPATSSNACTASGRCDSSTSNIGIARTFLDSCWYVMSCHKLFGPHLGILSGPTSLEGIETGTVNYESCAGLVGLGDYLERLATLEGEQPASQSQSECKDRREAEKSNLSIAEGIKLSRAHVLEAYRRIAIVEDELLKCLMDRLSSTSSKVHVLESKESSLCSTRRVPVVAFHHETINGEDIVKELSEHKVAVRFGSFLCSEQLQFELGFQQAVRLSLAHYNTTFEVNFVMDRLEEMPGW